MDYQRIYNSIVSHAKARTDVLDRVEKHHVIPRSFGGSDLPENLVRVSPREHFILHLLLTKFTTGKHRSKMVMALMLIIKNTHKKLGRSYVTSRRYDASRFYEGIVFSDEHRKKLSDAAKRRSKETYVRSEAAKAATSATMKGRKRTQEHQDKIAAAQRGQKRKSWGQHSDETKIKLSIVHKGKPKSEEHRRNIALAQIGRKRAPWSLERREAFNATIALKRANRAATDLEKTL